MWGLLTLGFGRIGDQWGAGMVLGLDPRGTHT